MSYTPRHTSGAIGQAHRWHRVCADAFCAGPRRGIVARRIDL